MLRCVGVRRRGPWSIRRRCLCQRRRHAESLYGWAASEVLGRNADIIVPSLDGAPGAAEIWAQLQAGNTWSGEFLLRRRDGTTFSAWITDSPIFDEQGKLIGMVGVSTD